jgi:hypothetical protein
VYLKHTINIDKCASQAHNRFNPSARNEHNEQHLISTP